MSVKHFDVLIVGAGLSGIGAAVHLQEKCPTRSFAILEGRDAIGGTWDLFRYPGIRSDSDMYTLGYSFRPWTDAKAIADGPSILQYINDTAREHGLAGNILFAHRVKRASWSSRDERWMVEIEKGHEREPVSMSCNFLWICGGYYNYEHGYEPEFPGIERFAGRIVHPQHWPSHLDYANKRVVVIGSGATAITLVPAMTDQAAHVTMLQRSPTYIVSLPSEDRFANFLKRRLSRPLAYGLTRWKNVLLAMVFFGLARSRPGWIKRLMVYGVKRELGPGFDVKRDFTPNYRPWDQRVCVIPDSDLLQSLKQGKASVLTDQIDTFTEQGIRLVSGKVLPADIVVTATGLDLLALGGIELAVDEKPVVVNATISYKGMMLADVPNLAYVFGYTNASWTLKADLVSYFVCRLLNHLEQHGLAQGTPRLNDHTVKEEDFLDFSSGYIQRSLDKFPRQGSKKPWRVYQNYLRDMLTLRFGPVDDGVMEFKPAPYDD